MSIHSLSQHTCYSTRQTCFAWWHINTANARICQRLHERSELSKIGTRCRYRSADSTCSLHVAVSTVHVHYAWNYNYSLFLIILLLIIWWSTRYIRVGCEDARSTHAHMRHAHMYYYYYWHKQLEEKSEYMSILSNVRDRTSRISAQTHISICCVCTECVCP